MSRSLNLRQIEAFKAIIEAGTVSRAADVLHVSQPAVSKLLAHLEHDTGLRLFERVRGRLAPTPRGMRLYEEVHRIFAGIRQVERAVDVIRREEQGHLVVGVLPGLSTTFIQRVTTAFLRRRPHVYVSLMAPSSHVIVDWLATRQIDIGLISARMDNPYVEAEPILGQPLVCILPRDHALAKRRAIRPSHLRGVPFISFSPGSETRQRLDAVFDAHNERLNVVVDATTAPTVCEFVAAGVGVSLVHPSFAIGMRGHLAVRRFEPAIPFDFRLCRARSARNAELVEAYVGEARAAAAAMSREAFSAA
jgi:DNA-binding transcriptional LysR family regulator